MTNYTQTDRPLQITTPLGTDTLLIRGLHGHEEISHLFAFEVNLVADLTEDVRFDKIMGQSVTVQMRLRDGGKRYFNGIVQRFSLSDQSRKFLFGGEMILRT